MTDDEMRTKIAQEYARRGFKLCVAIFAVVLALNNGAPGIMLGMFLYLLASLV